MKQTIYSHAPAIRRAALLLALGLSGCGGSDEGEVTSPLPPPVTSTVTVLDGFSTATPDTPTKLDLSPFVRGKGATLTAISSTQPGCDVSAPSNFNVDVTIVGGNLCSYSYSARIADGPESSATLSVLASRASQPLLEPLSYAHTLGQANPVFDLYAELGDQWPAGDYSLDASSVTVQGGSVQGTAVASGNNITYTPPSSADWNRILFVLKDSAKPTEDVLGTIYVTTSATANGAPTIELPKYDYQANNQNVSIKTFDSVSMNLGTLQNLGIEDPDGDEWQLVEVQSYTATVLPKDPYDTSNKVFTFSAATVGEHIVSYVVGDHRGGFRMGLMSIAVGAKEQAKGWGDIDLMMTEGLFFYAPPLYSELKGSVSPGFIVEPVWDVAVNSGSGNTIGAAGNLAATAYCSGKRLPVQADLDALRTVTGNEGAARSQYPQGRPYLITDAAGTAFQAYNLNTGTLSAYTPGVTASPYIMCVSDFEMSYQPTPDTPYPGLINTAISDDQWHSIGILTSSGGAVDPYISGNPTNYGSGRLSASNFRLNPAGCVGDTCTLQARGASDEYGRATVMLKNANDPMASVSVRAVLLQDAKVMAASVTTDYAMANNIDSNVITLFLTDNAGNALSEGTPVQFSPNKIDVSSNASVTDSLPLGEKVNVGSDGTVVVSFKALTGSDMVSSFTAGIRSNLINALRTVGGYATVTFTEPLIPNFVKPDNMERNWSDADAYCRGFGQRLPTRIELKDMFVDFTSSEGDGSANYEMCTIYGWPLIGCGNGYHYYWTSDEVGPDIHHNFDLVTGSTNYNSDSNLYNVTCVP